MTRITFLLVHHWNLQTLETEYLCDRAGKNKANMHTKFDPIFEFQTSITLLIKIVI